MEWGTDHAIPGGLSGDYLDRGMANEKVATEAKDAIMSYLTRDQAEAELDALDIISNHMEVLENRVDMWQLFFSSLYETAIYRSFKVVNGYMFPFDFDDIIKEREEIKRIGIEAFEKAEKIAANRKAGGEKARKTRAEKVAEELFFAGLALGGAK